MTLINLAKGRMICQHRPMQIPNDPDHRKALSVALDMVLADHKDPGTDLAALMEPYIAGAPSPHAGEVRMGLVCRYLTKIASQLATIIDGASHETFEAWVKEMRALSSTA